MIRKDERIFLVRKNNIKIAAIAALMLLNSQNVFSANVNDYNSLKEAVKGSGTAPEEINLTGNITDWPSASKSEIVFGGDSGNYSEATINGQGFSIDATGIKDTVNTIVFDVKPNATLNLKNLTISNFGKTSGDNWGGTIYADGNLNLDNVALNSNAVKGGIVSGGAITSVGKAVTNIMGNSSFSKNNAYDYGRGGAIYNLASTIITAADGKSISFSENHAVNQGGAIFSGVYTGNNANLVGVGTLDIKTEGTGSVLFTGNTANYGGAIANSGTATIIGDAIKFESNSAKNGGAISNDGTITMDGAKFSTNSATSGGVGGGAIYNTADAQIFLSGNTSFDSNISTRYGGAIYNAGSIRISNDGDTINFTGNKANNESGGAIYNNGTGRLMMMGDGEFVFESNTAKNGGAIYNAGVMSLAGKYLFQGNQSTNAGGALYNSSGSVTISGTRDASGNASIRFVNNSAGGGTHNGGGALFIIGDNTTASFLDITGVDFEGNSTISHGGAFYLHQNVDFNLIDTKFVGNRTTITNGQGWGGAIGLGNGRIAGYVENSEFDSNYAGDAGGVIAANTAITFVNSKFINNSARFSGGAISYNPQNSSVGKYLKLIADGADTVFAGNNVTESAGGGGKNHQGQEGLYIGNFTDVNSENDSMVYFNAGNSGSLIFNDIVNATGESQDDTGKDYTRNGINKNIQLNRDGVSYGKLEPTSANAATNLAPTNGKIIFNNTVRGANLVLHNGTLAFGQSNSYGSYVDAENVGKYLTDGAKITLKGGTLDLLNKHIESGDMIAPENLNVLGSANLWLDIELDRNENGSLKGAIDKINSNLVGNGKLTLSKFSFKDSKLPSGVDFSKANFDAGKFTTKLTFANNNTLANTILEASLATVITSNAGYSLKLENDSSAGTGKNALEVTQVVSAGGLPVAVSLGQDRNLAAQRTYIYNATADEIIGESDNEWNKGYKIFDNSQIIDRKTSNVLQGDLLQINGNGMNVIGANNVIGIALGVETLENGSKQQQKLKISDVKKADGSGWYGFNTAIINKGGKVTLIDSIFSKNNSTVASYTDIKGITYNKAANGGAVINEIGESGEVGELNIVNTNFKNNTATGGGGAIYNKGITNITATDSNTVEFTDNKANSNLNDIYNEGTLNLITSVDGKIIFNSGISGNSANLGKINIGNDVNSNLGSVILNSTVSNQNVNLNSGTLQVGNTSKVFDNVNLTMDGGTLNSINNQIDTINVNDLTLGTNNQSTFMFDVDLNTKSDIINVANNFTQNKTLILGPLNIYNNMATTEYKTKFMSDSANAIQAELASAAKYVTVNGVTYNLNVKNNELVITIAGESGGFNYEVINQAIASRTYNVTQDENVIEWINGNHNLAGSEFYINGDNSHIINGTNTVNGVTKTLEGIIVGIDENQNQQKLDIVNVKSYQGFDSAVINNQGLVYVSGSTLEENNSTGNGGAIRNMGGEVDIKGSSIFQNNTAANDGGAIYNTGLLKIDATSVADEIIFTGNKANGVANDIYSTGTIDLTGNGTVQFDGGIAGNRGTSGNGSIKSAVSNLVLNGDNSGYTGEFNLTAGTTTVAKDAKFFSGTSNITGGNLVYNSTSDLVDSAVLNMTGGNLTLGNGTDQTKLTIKGASSIAGAKVVTINNNAELALEGKTYTVKDIRGNGTFSAANSDLTVNSTSKLTDSINLATKNSKLSVIGTSADSVITALSKGTNQNLTLTLDNSTMSKDFVFDKDAVSSLNTKNTVTVDGNVNYSGTINNDGDLTSNGTLTSDTTGVFNNSANVNVKASAKDYKGTYNQTAGTTTVDSSSFVFGGVKEINGGSFVIKDGEVNYTNVNLGSGSELSHVLNTATGVDNKITSEVFKFTGSGATAKFDKGDVLLAENIKNGDLNNTISISNGKVTLGTNDYTGGTVYNFDKSDIKLGTGNTTVRNYEFSKITGSNNKLSFNVIIKDKNAEEGSKYLETDRLIVADGNNQTLDFGDIYISGKENGWRGTYTTETGKDVLEGNISFSGNPNPLEITKLATGATTSWIYDISKTANDKSIEMVINRAANENTLYDMNHLTDGTRFFQFSDYDKNNVYRGDQTYNIGKSIGETLAGKFTVSGYDKEKCTISGAIVDATGNPTGEHGSFFDIRTGTDVILNIKDVSIVDAAKTGSGSVVSNVSENGVVNISDVILANNSSTEKGGAIYNDNKGTVNITNTEFTGNKSNDVGGAIYNNANLTLTNVILNKGTGAAKNDLAQGVDGKTIFEGVNKVLSGISGKGTIENKGYLELNGSDNYGVVGEFIQNSANAVTKVVGNNFNSSVYFGGTSTITDGILWWMTTDQSGKLNMSGNSQLIIGDLDNNNNFTGEGEYKLKLANGDSIADTVLVAVDKKSEVAISDADVTLNENDAWLGMIDLTQNGKLTLKNLQGNGTIYAVDGGILNLKSGDLYINNTDSLIDITAKVVLDEAGRLVISDSNVTLNGTTTGQVTVNGSAFDDSDTWNGQVLLANGKLTAGGFDTNGILQAIGGNLIVDGGKLNIGEGSAILESVVTTVNAGSNLNINGGSVSLNENDNWFGTITLEDGNLVLNNFDNSLVEGEGFDAKGGNLSLVNTDFVLHNDNYKIAQDATVYLDNSSKFGVKAGELNLDGNDYWAGDVEVNGGKFIANGLVFDGKNGQTWNQWSGSTTFKDSFVILMDEKSGISGGDLYLISSDMKFGSEASTMVADNLYMKDSAIDMMNGGLEEHNVGSAMDVNGTNHFGIDVAPRLGKIGESDYFTIGKLTSSTNGTLNVDDFNFVGLAPIDRQLRFRVFDANQIDDNVKFTATNKQIFTPIGYYDIQSAGGGWYTSNMVKYNPQVFRGQVATMATYNNQLMIDEYVLNHVMLESEQSLAQSKNTNKYAATLPQFAPYQYRKEDGGLWFKSYVNFESLSMTQGLKVGNNSYGSLIGADFPVINMKRGWKFMPTAYIGYNGAHQTFNGVGMYQNGGQGGVMGTFMKNDFIGSVLAYGGGYNNEMSVAGYTDHTGNWFAGTAAKLAYNLHATKHFTIQPTAFVSYNIFGKQHWGTDYGAMSMNSGLLNGINVAPGVNFIYARETWSAYATFQYMYNINDQVGGKAGNVDLASVEMKHGYIQYGVGVTKTWKDRLNSFFQIVFRNGGRTGVGFQLGLNYSFDWTNPFKSKSKTKSKSELKNNANSQAIVKPQRTIIKAMSVEQRTAYQQKDGKTVIKSLSMK